MVVDTLISAKEAQRFIKDIRAVSDKPIRYVVNTHDHLDHVLGNSEFAKLGAVIIAQAGTKAAMVKNGDGLLQRAKYFGLSDEAMSGTTVVVPSLTFSDAMEIDLGDRKVEVIHAGPSHTGGSSIVYVPDSKTLFAGDILFTNYHPNMRDGDIQGWVKALDLIASMDVTNIIPGHGPLVHEKGRCGHEKLPDRLRCKGERAFGQVQRPGIYRVGSEEGPSRPPVFRHVHRVEHQGDVYEKYDKNNPHKTRCRSRRQQNLSKSLLTNSLQFQPVCTILTTSPHLIMCRTFMESVRCKSEKVEGLFSFSVSPSLCGEKLCVTLGE